MRAFDVIFSGPAAFAALLLFAPAAAPAASDAVCDSAETPRAEAAGREDYPVSESASPGCGALLDSLDRLHAADRADYLAWDFAAAGCDRRQLYRAYHRQGFGSQLLGDWQAAALYLTLAKDIGGPEDEEVLYHLWTAWRGLDSRQDMVAAARELHARFPASPWLARILDEMEEVRKPRARAFGGSLESRLARSRVGSIDNDLSTRLRAVARQSAGDHAFSQAAAFSLKHNVRERVMEGFQANLSAEWRRGGFGLEAEWGLGYDASAARDTLVSALHGSGSGLQYAGWNGRMAQLGATWMRAGEGDWTFGARLGARLLSRDWWAAGATLSPAWQAGDWSVSLLLDVQRHGMDWSHAQDDTLAGNLPVTLAYAMEGMGTLQAAVSPSLRLGRHELGLGLGWFLVRYASTLSIAYAGMVETEPGTAWEHSLALSPSWRLSLGRLRFHLGANVGFDFEERGADAPACRAWLPGYCAGEAYGADAGFAYSF